jgi:thiol-disulfide isomerase/thioredoxin
VVARRLWIPALCVVALGATDAGVRYFRHRSAPAGTTATTAGALRVLDEPLPLRPFSATDLDGRDISPSTWRGRFALVNFWATWCPPCRDEIPALVALQTRYADRLQVIGVLQDQVTPDFARAFATSLRINYPVVFSTWEIESSFSEVLALPTSFLVDPDGRIIATHVGPIDVASLAGRLTGPVGTRHPAIFNPHSR